MKKPSQLTLFDLNDNGYSALEQTRPTRWWYIGSHNKAKMVALIYGDLLWVEHDFRHQLPWLTNSKKTADRQAATLAGGYVYRFPHDPSKFIARETPFGSWVAKP